MKIAVLVSLARQVEGEYVFMNVLRAHTDPDVLKQHLAETDLPKTGTFGNVDCVIEYGVFKDIEVEGV